MPVNERALLQQIMELAPLGDEDRARQAVTATLRALGACLTSDEADALAEDLGGELARELGTAAREAASLAAFYERVAHHEGTRTALAMEHARVVCAVLNEHLSDASRRRMNRHLPELAALFRPFEQHPSSVDPYLLRSTPAPEHTLGSGRPGSSRPLSESRPGSRRPLSSSKPEPEHAHSVASSDDPHDDTKLSSARGLTQEREENSLGRSHRSVPR